jgi:hypothetical protein
MRQDHRLAPALQRRRVRGEEAVSPSTRKQRDSKVRPSRETQELPPRPGAAPVTHESDDVDLWGHNTDPLKKAIETQRYQMDVIDTLLACLHASFEAEIDYAMHRLQPPEPAYVIVAARKMLRDCIRGLDSSVLGPMIRAARDTSTQSHP